MKAAVLHQYGNSPEFAMFPDPVPAEGQELIHVRAAAVKQLDKLKASGKHYTAYSALPAVVGTDGAGILSDGTPVFAMGVTGMMAEQALVGKNSWVKLPAGLDFETAAALPNALIGSDVALLYRARLQAGEVVLINGATGVSGRMAVQMARHRGAARVIVTGRNESSLEELKALGADEVISLRQEEAGIIAAFRQAQEASPVDVVLDYLWGRPVELLLEAYRQSTPRRMRIVTIGEMAGADIRLSSGILRSTQLELLGSGIGAVSMAEIGTYMREVLPGLFEQAAAGALKIAVERVPLSEIGAAWMRDPVPGRRMVVGI